MDLTARKEQVGVGRDITPSMPMMEVIGDQSSMVPDPEVTAIGGVPLVSHPAVDPNSGAVLVKESVPITTVIPGQTSQIQPEDKKVSPQDVISSVPYFNIPENTWFRIQNAKMKK